MSKDVLSQVKLITKTYNITPQKSKGQNFLIDLKVIDDTIKTANLSQKDVVLEVGPGLGVLTEALVKNAGKVISVELDKNVVNFLKVKFIKEKKLELINTDILNLNDTKDLPLEYKIVANLPYNITSIFLKKFLTAKNKPAEMVLLLQKEVAQRLVSKPGQMNLLALSAQLYSNPEIIREVSSTSFWPVPKVSSAIIKLSSVKTAEEVDKVLQGVAEKDFWRLARVGFAAKRKQLQNNLASGLHISPEKAKNMLKKANLDEKVRAQELGVTDWVALVKVLES